MEWLVLFHRYFSISNLVANYFVFFFILRQIIFIFAPQIKECIWVSDLKIILKSVNLLVINTHRNLCKEMEN